MNKLYNHLLANNTGTIEDFLKNKGSGVLDYIIKIAIAIILFYILRTILKKLSTRILKRLDKRGVDEIASRFIINIIRYGIIIFAIFTIITQLNIVKEASIAALVASAGVGISLAMQGALSNFAGGVLLLVLKPFKKGDYIIIPNANVEGTVEEIQTYYTTIRTILDETVKIPNSQLTNNSVINKQGNETRALIVKVSVKYDTDINNAKEILRKIIDDQEDTLDSGKDVFVEELGDSAVVLGIMCMVPVLKYNSIRRTLNEKIILEFKKQGISIPYNQMDVHIIS